MDLPFDGAISKYFKNDAPKDVRRAIEKAGKDAIMSAKYPYREEMKRLSGSSMMTRFSQRSTSVLIPIFYLRSP